jgi:hypothetical protein
VNYPKMLVIAVPVFLISLVFVVSHLVSWRRFGEREEAEPEYETRFRRNQFRRRLQASVMLGLVAAAMVLGTAFISSDDQPRTFLGLWTGVLLTVLWVILLAGADLIATRRHANRLRREVMAENREMHDDIRREFGTSSDRHPGSHNGHNGHSGH